MKQKSKWPAIDPVFKDWVIDYFAKCNKMGRPLRSEHIKTDIDTVKDAVLYMPVWGPDENCWVDNEFISVKVFSHYDTPNKYMLVTVRTRSNEVDNLFIPLPRHTIRLMPVILTGSNGWFGNAGKCLTL